MRNISNKVMVLLLTFALVITIASTIFTLQKLSSFSQTFSVITGAPSFSFGETNITVSSVTSLSLASGNGTAISFGTGYVNGSCNGCQMDSNGISTNFFGNGSNTTTNVNQATCCVSFTIPTSGFLLENTGNTNLSVGYTCTGNCTFATYLGGVRSPGMGGLEIKVTANTVASQTGEEGVTDTTMSCLGGGILYRDGGWNITNSSDYTGSGGGSLNGTKGGGVYAPLSNRGHYLCGNSSNFPLMPDNTQDAGVVDINLTILTESISNLGVSSSFRLTFNGSSS